MDCYICKKEIKKDQPFISIGKGLNRHKKCSPGLPKGLKKENKMTEEQKEVAVEAPVVVETKKRGRGRPKGSKNKPKVKKDEQKA